MNENRIEHLITNYLGRNLTEEEKVELTDWLDEEESHRDRFRESIEIEYALTTQLPAGIRDNVTEYRPGDLSEEKGRASVISWRWEHAGIAALLLLCLSLTWSLWRGGIPSNDPSAFRETTGSIAQLSGISDDAIFSSEHAQPSAEGDHLNKGWIKLDQGSVEISFSSGAIVDLTGPALFGIDSPMRGFLEFGEVEVYAPPEARDFTIGTSALEVVDLGTNFELSVDSNTRQAEISVLKGLVDLHLGGDGAQPSIQPLPAGLSASVDVNGELLLIDGKLLDPETGVGSSLVAHWTLDEVDPDGNVMDDSGRGRHVQFLGDTRQALLTGKVGRGLNLSDGGRLDISDHIAVMTSAPTFTLAAWVRDADDMVFSLSGDSPRNRVQFELHGNNLLYGWSNGPRFDDIRGRVQGWEEGQWYHIAVSISGGTVTLYRDGNALISRSEGQKINTKTRIPVDIENPTNAFIGYLLSNFKQESQELGGQIDDVQIYGTALDGRAVRFLYEHPGQTWTESGLAFDSQP